MAFVKNTNWSMTKQNAGFYNKTAQFNVATAKPITQKGGAKKSTYVPTTGSNKGENMIVVNAWKKTKTDFLIIKANKTSKSEVKENGWMGHIAITVVSRNTGQEQFYWGSMHEKTGLTKVDKLGLVLNPKNDTCFFNFNPAKANRR